MLAMKNHDCPFFPQGRLVNSQIQTWHIYTCHLHQVERGARADLVCSAKCETSPTASPAR